MGAFDVEDRPKIKSRPRIVIMLKKLYGHGSAKKKRLVAKGLLRSRKDILSVGLNENDRVDKQ